MSRALDTGRARQINAYVQQQLSERGLKSVTPTEAAEWLDAAGVLRNTGKPGQRLRDYLRAGLIEGGHQFPNRRWVIDRVRR